MGRKGSTMQRTAWLPTAVNVVLAALSWPVAYLFNKGASAFSPGIVLIAASLILTAIVVFVKCLVPSQPKIFYGFSLFVFTSALDLFFALQMSGYVSNALDVYLESGEPYLRSAWGAVASLWDGTFNLACYLLMAFYASNGLSYRNLALFYSSNMLNGVIVLLLAALIGHSDLHWCTLLNIPYFVLPAYVLWTALAESSSERDYKCKRHVGRFIALLLILAAVICCIRGMSALGSRMALMKYYRSSVEPLMNQTVPAPFAGMQLAVFLFYFAPTYVVMAVALLSPLARGWVRDLAVVMTGAAVQAEVSLVGMAWHSLTQPEHRLAADAGSCALVLHWAAHGLVLAAPAAAALALSCAPDTKAKAKRV